MPTELHDRIRELLEAALQRPTVERTRFLRLTAADGTVLREALALLPHFAAVARPGSAGTTRRLPWLPRTTSLRRAFGLEAYEPEWEPPFGIAPYTAVEVVGRGGMGVVYRALDAITGREVAIKVLRGRLSSPADEWRFKHEEELLRQLRHPGIVRLLHGGTAQLPLPGAERELAPRPYFVMEFVRGPSLLTYVAQRGLDSLQRLALFVEVCAAAEYAHHRGVIHRDLKPENILVDETGQPKILDFGIARLQPLGPASDATRQFSGTAAYASPEQWAGYDAALTPASDVYTLGLILHELLTGRLPQRAEGGLVLDLSQVQLPSGQRYAPDEPATFRYALHTLIATALRQTPGPRYAHAGELGAGLAAVTAVYAPAHGWRAWLARLVAPFGAAADAPPTGTHDRLLGVVLRRRIGLALGSQRERGGPAGR